MEIDPLKPGRIERRAGFRLDSRARAFEALAEAAAMSATLEEPNLTVGQGEQIINITIGRLEPPVAVDLIDDLLTKIAEPFPPDAPVTMSFKRANFASGHDLQAFVEKLGLDLKPGELIQ